MIILAESGSAGFNFGSFQQAFHDVWEFVFPNALVLCISIWIAKYVGHITLPWLRVPWDRLRERLKEISKFLSESNLFGSKLLPAVVMLCLFIAALDIFQVVRLTAENVLPPTIVTIPARLYARLAQRQLLLKVFASDGSIRRQDEVYERVAARGLDLERDVGDKRATNYWADEIGRWWRYAGDFKLLVFVAIISCVAGLSRRHWRSPVRLLLILVPLSLGFVFCLAKHLYARKQQAFVVLSTLEQQLKDVAVDNPSDILRKRAAALGDEKWLLGFDVPAEKWWELRWFDLEFFHHGAELFGLPARTPTPGRNSIWTAKELQEAGIDSSGDSSPPPHEN